MKQNNSTEIRGYSFTRIYNRNGPQDPLHPKSDMFSGFSGIFHGIPEILKTMSEHTHTHKKQKRNPTDGYGVGTQRPEPMWAVARLLKKNGLEASEEGTRRHFTEIVNSYWEIWSSESRLFGGNQKIGIKIRIFRK